MPDNGSRRKGVHEPTAWDGRLPLPDPRPRPPANGKAIEEPCPDRHRNGDALRAHFHLAPPRNFQYPAILLLLAEEPRHGYRLVDALLHLGFGPVDRPSVYRALGDLEHDALVTSKPAKPTSGSTRHVYALTDLGHRALAQWMRVIEAERDGLVRVTARYAGLGGAEGRARPP